MNPAVKTQLDRAQQELVGILADYADSKAGATAAHRRRQFISNEVPWLIATLTQTLEQNDRLLERLQTETLAAKQAEIDGLKEQVAAIQGELAATLSSMTHPETSSEVEFRAAVDSKRKR